MYWQHDTVQKQTVIVGLITAIFALNFSTALFVVCIKLGDILKAAKDTFVVFTLFGNYKHHILNTINASSGLCQYIFCSKLESLIHFRVTLNLYMGG